jgi:hypothetical protein
MDPLLKEQIVVPLIDIGTTGTTKLKSLPLGMIREVYNDLSRVLENRSIQIVEMPFLYTLAGLTLLKLNDPSVLRPESILLMFGSIMTTILFKDYQRVIVTCNESAFTKSLPLLDPFTGKLHCMYSITFLFIYFYYCYCDYFFF